MEGFNIFLEITVPLAHEDFAAVRVIVPGLGAVAGITHGNTELLDD